MEMRPLAEPPDAWRTLRCTYDPKLSFTRGQASRIAARVAAALTGLHAAKIVHGDVYAHNIFFSLTDGEEARGGVV